MKCPIPALLLMFLMASLLSASADLVSAKHIRYRRIAGQPALRQILDVHYRTDDTANKKPVIVWVHGGAWKFGNKSHSIGAKAKAFTKAGYVVVAINYRFHPQVNWKEQAADVAAACRWITGGIEKYGGDARRLILMGHSAGAHLAALTGADPTYTN